MPIKAVAFDAFGTLVRIGDKRHPFAAIAKAATKPPGFNPMTRPTDLAHFAAACGATWLPAWADDLAAELVSVQPYPETRELVAHIQQRGLRTAVASNLAAPYATPLQQILGPLVDVSCYSFEVGAVKPDGQFYAALCDRLGCLPAEILMIGDTWHCDYEGAAAAGLKALHLDRRGNATLAQGAVTVRDLCGMIEMLNAFDAT